MCSHFKRKLCKMLHNKITILFAKRWLFHKIDSSPIIMIFWKIEIFINSCSTKSKRQTNTRRTGDEEIRIIGDTSFSRQGKKVEGGNEVQESSDTGDKARAQTGPFSFRSYSCFSRPISPRSRSKPDYDPLCWSTRRQRSWLPRTRSRKIERKRQREREKKNRDHRTGTSDIARNEEAGWMRFHR